MHTTGKDPSLQSVKAVISNTCEFLLFLYEDASILIGLKTVL